MIHEILISMILRFRQDRLIRFENALYDSDPQQIERLIEEPSLGATRTVMLNLLLRTASFVHSSRLPLDEIARLSHVLLDKGASARNVPQLNLVFPLTKSALFLGDVRLMHRIMSTVGDVDELGLSGNNSMLAQVCFDFDDYGMSKETALEMAIMLLDLGADPNNVFLGSVEDPEFVELLTARGLDVSFSKGWPENHDALRWRARYYDLDDPQKSRDLIDALVDAGLNGFRRLGSPEPGVSDDTFSIHSALAIALSRGRWINALQLIDRLGFDPEESCNDEGDTLWHMVCMALAESARTSSVNLSVEPLQLPPRNLIEHLLAVSPDKANHEGVTPHSLLSSCEQYAGFIPGVRALAEEKALLANTALVGQQGVRPLRL